jgi:hypothetical protein
MRTAEAVRWYAWQNTGWMAWGDGLAATILYVLWVMAIN